MRRSGTPWVWFVGALLTLAACSSGGGGAGGGGTTADDGGGDDGGPNHPYPTVTVSGTISYPAYTSGDFAVFNVVDSLASTRTVIPGGTSVAYSLELPADSGFQLLGAGLAMDGASPCHIRPIATGPVDIAGFNFTLEPGGCGLEATDATPVYPSVGNTAFPDTTVHKMTPGSDYSVTVVPDNLGAFDLRVYNDTNRNGRYEAGTDTLACSDTTAGSATKTCSIVSAGYNQALILVSLQLGADPADGDYTLTFLPNGGTLVNVSGTVTHTRGTVDVDIVDVIEQILGQNVLKDAPEGIPSPVPFSAQYVAGVGERTLRAVVDTGYGGEDPPNIRPCDEQVVDVQGTDVTGVSFIAVEGGCVMDLTDRTPAWVYTQNVPYAAHFSHAVQVGRSYTVRVAEAEQPVDLQVYADTDGDFQWDSGTDTLLCQSATTGQKDEACSFAASHVNIIIRVKVESGLPLDPGAGVPFTLVVTDNGLQTVQVSGTITYPSYTTGTFFVATLFGPDNFGQVLVPGGTAVPYTITAPANSTITVAAMLDEDGDGEFTHFIDPCAWNQSLAVGSVNLTGQDFAINDGGCFEDITGLTPWGGFTQGKAQAARYRYVPTSGNNVQVNITADGQDVSLTVNEDVNGNGIYDGDGTDTVLCSDTAGLAPNCNFISAAGNPIFIRVLQAPGWTYLRTDITIDVSENVP